MSFTGVSLILLATVRFTLDVTYLFIAFIHKDPREARLAFLQDVHVELFISKHAMLVTALLIGDCFMVRPGRCFYTPPVQPSRGVYRFQGYRCWAVWGRNIWVAILPVLCSVAGTGKSVECPNC